VTPFFSLSLCTCVRISPKSDNSHNSNRFHNVIHAIPVPLQADMAFGEAVSLSNVVAWSHFLHPCLSSDASLEFEHATESMALHLAWITMNERADTLRTSKARDVLRCCANPDPPPRHTMPSQLGMLTLGQRCCVRVITSTPQAAWEISSLSWRRLQGIAYLMPI